MEFVDVFVPGNATGDLVSALVNFDSGDDDDESVYDMVILGIERFSGTMRETYFVKMTPIDNFLQEEDIVYTLQMCHGDLFMITTGTGIVTFNEEHVFVLAKKNKALLSGELVGMGSGSKQDIEAKFDAYMDPMVAALGETPGRITRQRAYKCIGT